VTDENGRVELWEQHAGWWQREFTDGADAEYEEQIIPLALQHLEGVTRVLDIGCGEGQIARRATAAIDAVRAVVGVDPTGNQIREAARRGGRVAYAQATAHRLPFGAASFDAVLMCLVIEHIDDFEAAFREVARVLVPGGRFLLFLNHPLLQTPGSGWIDDHILEEQYWRVGPYLRDDLTLEEVSPGVTLPFLHRPLSRYVHALGEMGLLIEDLEEPPPPPGFLDEAWQYQEASTIPRLMMVRARRLDF
jgi:SAM-dependent methyltransferase